MATQRIIDFLTTLTGTVTGMAKDGGTRFSILEEKMDDLNEKLLSIEQKIDIFLKENTVDGIDESIIENLTNTLKETTHGLCEKCLKANPKSTRKKGHKGRHWVQDSELRRPRKRTKISN